MKTKFYESYKMFLSDKIPCSPADIDKKNFDETFENKKDEGLLFFKKNPHLLPKLKKNSFLTRLEKKRRKEAVEVVTKMDELFFYNLFLKKSETTKTEEENCPKKILKAQILLIKTTIFLSRLKTWNDKKRENEKQRFEKEPEYLFRKLNYFIEDLETYLSEEVKEYLDIILNPIPTTFNKSKPDIKSLLSKLFDIYKMIENISICLQKLENKFNGQKKITFDRVTLM